MTHTKDSLHDLRLKYPLDLPKMLEEAERLTPFSKENAPPVCAEVAKFFPHLKEMPYLSFKIGQPEHKMPIRIGALFSGGQAPGGHNVLSGLFDFVKKVHPNSQFFGFLGGPSGLIKNKQIELTDSLINHYRNQGGFDLLGSGRTKLETEEQFKAAEKTVLELNLDGLIIIGGDDSNTNAAHLAEYFISRNIDTCIVGVPKTIDGDLKNNDIEISFGFDTAVKIYSNLIANIQRDALSAKKYYHFIKLMGRTASHVTLECALRTHPNAALIGEEIAEQNQGLKEIVHELSNLICERSAKGKEFGVFLIPEGILEFIPDCKKLFSELNLLSKDAATEKLLSEFSNQDDKLDFVEKKLSRESSHLFRELPKDIRVQLLQERDPHGNIQVSQIESERLIIDLIKKELVKRHADGSYNGSFKTIPHFYGYEGRAGYPSNFDAHYCYALGLTAGVLVHSKASGYLACVNNLAAPVKEWEIKGVPLTSMMIIEERNGKLKPVIAKSLVSLTGLPFKEFKEHRAHWSLNDDYNYPGPIQFFGPQGLTEAITRTLLLESEAEESTCLHTT